MGSKNITRAKNAKEPKEKKGEGIEWETNVPLSPMETLRVYKDFKDFRRYAFHAIDKMPRWIKNSEGRECICAIKRCVSELSFVARCKDKDIKTRHIDSFLLNWDMIADSISFFYEEAVISKHQRSVLAVKKYGIEEQISKLRNWLVTYG